MFLKASKQKLRFLTEHGTLSTEDLWDLPLEALDTLAKGLKKLTEEADEESFIKPRNKSNTKVNLQFEVVKAVIKERLTDLEKAETAAEKKAKKAKILELIANKQDEAMGEKSIKQLTKELEEL